MYPNMTTPHNLYVTLAALRILALLDEYVNPMEEESLQSSKELQETTLGGSLQESQQQPDMEDKEIPIEEGKEPLPPSFHHTLTKETLCDNDCPYIFWASIQIPIPEKPDDPVTMMFKHLANFMIHMLEADTHFTMFPHNLSKYELLEDLPELLEDPDHIPSEVDDWLEYFPGAKPHASSSYMYNLALLGFSEPFPTVIKATATWLRKSKFGLWKLSLQSEKPVLLGWLLFLTSTMELMCCEAKFPCR